jgi:hypothetical protein
VTLSGRVAAPFATFSILYLIAQNESCGAEFSLNPSRIGATRTFLMIGTSFADSRAVLPLPRPEICEGFDNRLVGTALLTVPKQIGNKGTPVLQGPFTAKSLAAVRERVGKGAANPEGSR